ncbi:tRNA 2'-phosphotransferase 1 isoform X6 [Macaca fascicularis]|uniref:tRNA 2'-phosphotransferase 1 isoform X6 n=2 Tax=Macaca fascicularis TaxID=9541 RepID=UPI0032B054FF
MRGDPFPGPRSSSLQPALPGLQFTQAPPLPRSGSARPLPPRLFIGGPAARPAGVKERGGLYPQPGRFRPISLHVGPASQTTLRGAPVIWSVGLGLPALVVDGVTLDGFVPLGALLQLPQFHGFSAEDVQRVVDTNRKQRFALQQGDPSTGLLIRANQGHSLQVGVPELELMPLETPQALPPMLVHGTFWKHWPSILLKGLSCGGRTHIHLAPGLPGDPSVISGMRPHCEIAVFIDGPLALADGISFFRSANGVILTPGNTDGFLLPKYFKEALQLRPTRKPLSLAGDEETECRSGPKHCSRERRRIQQ